MAASANQTARGADVDGRRRVSDCGDEAIVGQDVADQFWKRVRLTGLERLGLDDQVVVARAASSRDQVDADRRWRGAVVRCSELVDDRLHAVRRVLRDLRSLRRLGRNDVADRYGHTCSYCSVCVTANITAGAAGAKAVAATVAMLMAVLSDAYMTSMKSPANNDATSLSDTTR